jgi:hypothetical protein
MLVPNADPFSLLEQAYHLGLLVGVVVVVCYVLVRRMWAKKRGFRGSCSHMGIALQQIQAIARPQIEYAIEEQLAEREDEDDEGGPDDPTRYYRRLRERIDQDHPRSVPDCEADPVNEAKENSKPEC